MNRTLEQKFNFFNIFLCLFGHLTRQTEDISGSWTFLPNSWACQLTAAMVLLQVVSPILAKMAGTVCRRRRMPSEKIMSVAVNLDLLENTARKVSFTAVTCITEISTHRLTHRLTHRPAHLPTIWFHFRSADVFFVRRAPLHYVRWQVHHLPRCVS